MGLLKKLPGMVNLIMFKPFQNALSERPDEKRMYVFRNILLNHGHAAVVRTAWAGESQPLAVNSE
jgi:adenine C2-methylase RlmN of 23S rRNA A2503 and tRNA A37